MNEKLGRHLIEDLLPLYEEGLLSPETTIWFEEQVKNNEKYKKIVELSNQKLTNTPIVSPIDNKKMFQQIHRKLTVYQIIFVTISFLLAINTSILNESFGFILSYTVLGFVTFLFYKDFKIVFYIAFLPIFLWSLVGTVIDYNAGNYMEGTTLLQFLMGSIGGSIVLSVIHFIFAIIGLFIAKLVLKIQEGN